MSKIRVCPVVLTDGVGAVKGRRFDSWRTVGTVQSSVRLFEARNVDEIFVLDVKARKRGDTISTLVIGDLAKTLRIPLTVGGGITATHEIAALLESGADRVAIGFSGDESSQLIHEAKSYFGSQALVCSIDYKESEGCQVYSHGGSTPTKIGFIDAVKQAEMSGAGEILLQSIDREGSMSGFDIHSLQLAMRETSIPVVVSGGYGSSLHAVLAANAGASALAIGTAFQFKAITPASVKVGLLDSGIRVR